MAVGFVADIVACTTTVAHDSWWTVLSAAYCLGVLAGGVVFGIIGSFAAAGLAATIHTIGTVLFCLKPLPEEGTLAAFAIIAVVAGWLIHRPARVLDAAADETIRNPCIHYSKPRVQATDWEHEFRTPLASIEGAAYVLEDRAISDEQRLESARIIRKECVRLQRLLESNSSVQHAGFERGVKRAQLGADQ